MLQHFRRFRTLGFTMLEMVVVLGIIGILAAVLTPIVVNYVDQGRVAKAQSDVKTIGESIARFERDVGRYPMFSSASGSSLMDNSANVVALQGVGSLPSATGASYIPWTTSASDTDCTATNPVCQFDTLQHQLMQNTPGYSINSSLAKPFQWKGPYMDLSSGSGSDPKIGSDPWGNAYLVNIIHCKSASTYACFVLDAGPNGTVETAFDQAKTAPLTVGNDDIIYRIK